MQCSFPPPPLFHFVPCPFIVQFFPVAPPPHHSYLHEIYPGLWFQALMVSICRFCLFFSKSRGYNFEIIDFDHPTHTHTTLSLILQCYIFRSFLIIFRRHYNSLVEVNQALLAMFPSLLSLSSFPSFFSLLLILVFCHSLPLL